jgi:hypothetical protein
MKHISEGQKEIIAHAIAGINELLSDRTDVQPDDLHNRLFNEDYFIVGYYAAEQFLIRCGGVFQAIGEVKEYEEDRFGELFTDLSSSEAVANMKAYIDGEQILFDCPTFSEALCRESNRALSEEELQAIIEELNNQL